MVSFFYLEHVIQPFEYVYKNNLMNQLSLKQIINIESQLLKQPGKTLSILHKNLLVQFPGNQNSIFKKFDKKYVSPKIGKMIIDNAYSMGTEPNAGLRAFSVVVLRLIFKKQINESLLAIIKSLIYSSQTDFSKITNIPRQGFYCGLNSLSNTESKKILVEFLHSLKYSSSQNKIQIQCKKYPLALQLLVILWRNVLVRFKVSEAQNYQKKNSSTAYEIMLEFLNVFFTKSGSLYLLPEDNIFIQNGYQNQKQQFFDEIIFGDYFQSEDQYKAKKILSKKNSLILNSDNLKIQSSKSNSFQLQIKQEKTEEINPFNLILPKDSQNALDSSLLSNNSRRSKKSSNAFQRASYNFTSNRSDRSECSSNLDDDQCDIPTPSFNQITQDEVRDPFEPKEQSIKISISKPLAVPINKYNEMKRSATIIQKRNKNSIFLNSVLKRSLIQDQKFHDSFQKNPLQIQRQILTILGLEQQEDALSGFNDNGNVVSSLERLLAEDSEDIKQIKSDFNENLTQFQKSEFGNGKEMMKSNPSKKDFSIGQAQTRNEESSKQPSLFEINCKKLKTSMQIDQVDLIQSPKIADWSTYNFDKKNFQQLFRYSTNACDCNAIKFQKNSINSNTVNFCYLPLNFTENQIEKRDQNILSSTTSRQKSKLNDDFFKKLKMKREEQKKKNPQNRSDHRSKQERKKTQKFSLINHSQFLKINDNIIQIPRSSEKESRGQNKKAFPTNFKKFQAFLARSPIRKNDPNNKIQSKDQARSLTSRAVYSKQESRRQSINFYGLIKTKQLSHRFSIEPRSHHLQQSLTCPFTKIKKNGVSDILPRFNTNQPFNNLTGFQFLMSENRRSTFNVFQATNSNGFSNSSNLFCKPISNRSFRKI